MGQGVVARTEEAKNGREAGEQKQAEREAHGDIENHHIAQDAPRRLVVFLPKADAHERRSAHADHGSEGSGECHEGIGECKACNGKFAHALADEDGVDDVVERGGHHRNDGGQRILQQERTDGPLTEFCKVVVL